MSTPCYLCSSDVYEAEKKVFDGKTFHGVCFGKWKKVCLTIAVMIILLL